MKFIVVEIKQKDLYTIYDADNKGVCCCSAYTLAQLQALGHTIIGFNTVAAGRISVKECGLDGKPREKKAPVICTDETKRSASTIARGLDEKHYPRVKQERNSTQSINTVNLAGLPQYKVAIRNQQTILMRVGDIFKFDVCSQGNAKEAGEISEIVCVIIKIYEFSDTLVPSGKCHEIHVITKTGEYLRFSAKCVISANSCRLSQNIRQTLYAVAENTETERIIHQQEQELRDSKQAELKSVTEKYQCKFEKLSNQATQLQQQRQILCNTLMQDSGIVSVEYMQNYIKKHYAENLQYQICRRTVDDCNAETYGTFDVYIGYNKQRAAWLINFIADIPQRTSYRELREKPYFYEEYDGELFGLSDDELLKKLGKNAYTELKAKYQKTLLHTLNNCEFKLTFDASGESRKGYYSYTYIMVYEVKGKGKPVMELTKFQEILEKIFK